MPYRREGNTIIHGFLHKADLSLSPGSATPSYLFISQKLKVLILELLSDRRSFITGFIAALRSIRMSLDLIIYPAFFFVFNCTPFRQELASSFTPHTERSLEMKQA